METEELENKLSIILGESDSKEKIFDIVKDCLNGEKDTYSMYFWIFSITHDYKTTDTITWEVIDILDSKKANKN